MTARRFIPPMSIVLFLALTLAGTYYARLKILERHMVAAMEMGDAETILRLADAFPSPVEAREEDAGRSPLIWAARKGRIDVARKLLARGAKVDGRGGCLQTALHEAAFRGRKEIAALLIDHGADVHARDDDGETPLHSAARGDTGETTELLIEKGAEIDARNRGQETPLHVAATGSKGMVEALLAKGADTTVMDASGMTPRDLAVARNRRRSRR